ncbi:MAG: TonB-dependent receptor, partial [Parabacteroides sp.]
ENIQAITLNYRIKAMTLGMIVFNPFTDNYKQETENWNRYASYHRCNYFKESSQLVIATFSYNFSFGRKYKDVQKKVNNSDSDSGIIKAGK